MAVIREFKPKTVLMGRLDKGADIIDSLETICKERQIEAAWVNILGAVDKATLSYYHQNDKKYSHHEIQGGYEIVSCIGNISLKDGKPFAHLHIVLSGEQDQTLGGHLWPGSTSVFAAEFILWTLESVDGGGPLLRCADIETGLALWK